MKKISLEMTLSIIAVSAFWLFWVAAFMVKASNNPRREVVIMVVSGLIVAAYLAGNKIKESIRIKIFEREAKKQ